MEERHGVRGTMCDGVFFTESAIPKAETVRRLAIEISRQNANLEDIKRRLATEAKRAGSAVIMNFRYGQKAHPWWEQVLTFKWDTESWHGEGDAIRDPR